MSDTQPTRAMGMTRKQLLRTVLIRFGLGAIGMGAILFIPAGTFRYWQAWLWLGALLIPLMFVATYMFLKDPALLERRMHTRETQKPQALMVKLSLIWFAVAFIIPGLDRRFHWSRVPGEVVVRQLAHPEVVDDEQRHRGEVCEVVLAGAVDRSVGDLLDEQVGLAVHDPVALLDGGSADGLREMALASARRAQSAIDRSTSNAYDLVIEGESYRPRLKPRLPKDTKERAR